MTDQPPRPSWERVAPRRRRSLELKLVIAILIGLVSVTGAVVAWQSSLAGEKATDKDRQAVAESVTVAQAEAAADVFLQDARVRFADHTAAIVNARLLEEQAQQFAAAGNAAAAQAAADEAVEQRAVARRALEGSDAPVLLAEYVDGGDGTAPPAFDESRFRDDLRRINTDRNQVDPSQTVVEARRLRADAQRLDGWLIALVGAIVVLTLAQISRVRVLRLGLAGLGTLIWLAATAIAFGGR